MENSEQNPGVFPYQMILEMIDKEKIAADKKNVQPASVDLSISNEIYEMKGAFLPQRGEKIEDIAKTECARRTSLDEPLKKNTVFLIKLNESLKLSQENFALASSKSSTGRVDLQTRLLTDSYPKFDMVPSGYKGNLWLQIIPKSFSIKLSANERLNQIRFYSCQEKIGWNQMKKIYEENQLLFDKNSVFIDADKEISKENGEKIVMSVDLEGNGEGSIIGYKNIVGEQILDFANIGGYEAKDFFEPIYATKNKKIVLEKESFYIFCTKEAVRIPRDFSGEMEAYDISSGEFRSHYAGFFDPGFGYGEKGEIKGRQAVLEIRSFDNNFLIRDGQPICQMNFEKLIEPTTFAYSEKIGSHYANQSGPKLSKHFR